ncbi:MAG: DUF3857 domain-containing protein [Candidatus Zixiibacteriota bacterium]
MKFLKLTIILFGLIIIPAVGTMGSDKGAHYDYLNWECTIGNNTAEIITKIKLTIENDRGMDYNDIVLYEDRFNSLSGVKVKILDANGKVVQKFKLSDFTKFCGYGASYTIFSDNCKYYREFLYPHFPYSIEYEYTTVRKSLFFWGGVNFQKDIPVSQASYKLIAPDNFPFRYKRTGSGISVNSLPVKSNTEFTWSANSLPALKDISYCPDGYPEVAGIRFQTEKFSFANVDFNSLNWSEIGRWYYKLASDCYLAPSEIDSQYLHPKTTNAREFVEQIYNDVNDPTRYVAISIEEGGWKPHRAADTRALNYGDCKDLSTLLISHLRTAGFTAYPVLALTRGNGKIDKDFPSFGFNHIFTMAIIDSDTLWLDPTCDLCAYDELPSSDENIDVLIVTESGGILRRTPISAPQDNHFKKETDVHVDQSGKLYLTTTLTYTGHYARGLIQRLASKDTDDRIAICRNFFPDNDKEFDLLEWEIINENDKYLPLIIKLKAAKKRPLDKLNNTFYLNPDLYDLFGSFKSLDISERDVPISQGYPALYEHSYKIFVDSGLKIDSISIPPSDSTNFGFCYLKTDYETTENKISVRFIRAELEYEIPVDKFDQFELFREEQKRLGSKYIKIYLH